MSIELKDSNDFDFDNGNKKFHQNFNKAPYTNNQNSAGPVSPKRSSNISASK